MKWICAGLAAVLLAGCGERESDADRFIRESRDRREEAREQIESELAEAERIPKLRREFFDAIVMQRYRFSEHWRLKKAAEFDMDRPRAEWVIAREKLRKAEADCEEALMRRADAEIELREADPEGWEALVNFEGELERREMAFHVGPRWPKLGDEDELRRLKSGWETIRSMNLEEAIELGRKLGARK